MAVILSYKKQTPLVISCYARVSERNFIGGYKVTFWLLPEGGENKGRVATGVGRLGGGEGEK